MADLQHEREVARLEQERLERLKAEELMFQQQQLALQLELEMQEKERQRIEQQRAQEQLEKEMRMHMENLAKGEGGSLSEEAAAAAAAEAAAKTLAEISDRYGAPNLSRVEELDEPVLSDVPPVGTVGEPPWAAVLQREHIRTCWRASSNAPSRAEPGLGGDFAFLMRSQASCCCSAATLVNTALGQLSPPVQSWSPCSGHQAAPQCFPERPREP
ncbi:DPY30 domain-containing protein 1 [Myotis davidii]|uniref:DPY30 domain-containing protein 1 n=1 Tax=Myotis davidii TaxID=225400 RepID=L5MEI0_MYODS|nr:DPY30 domain-containing protein 1 [Myotis davidii]